MIFNYNSDISTDMDSDSDEEGPPGLPGFGGGGGLPGMGPPGMWGGGHQQGHMWGEGQAMVGEVLNPEDNLPHHRKDPKALAGTIYAYYRHNRGSY